MIDNDSNEIDASELDQEFDELEFEVGYNQGYTIAELDPDLALELDNGVMNYDSDSSGFVAGIKEFLRARNRQSERENELNDIRNQNQERGRTR